MTTYFCYLKRKNSPVTHVYNDGNISLAVSLMITRIKTISKEDELYHSSEGGRQTLLLTCPCDTSNFLSCPYTRNHEKVAETRDRKIKPTALLLLNFVDAQPAFMDGSFHPTWLSLASIATSITTYST